eukprot:764090-Amphidinium_carterae.1
MMFQTLRMQRDVSHKECELSEKGTYGVSPVGGMGRNIWGNGQTRYCNLACPLSRCLCVWFTEGSKEVCETSEELP